MADGLEERMNALAQRMTNVEGEMDGLGDKVEAMGGEFKGSMSILRQDLIEEREKERKFIIEQQTLKAQLAIVESEAQTTQITARMKQLGVLVGTIAAAAGGIFAAWSALQTDPAPVVVPMPVPTVQPAPAPAPVLPPPAP